MLAAIGLALAGAALASGTSSPASYLVQITASPQDSPAQITLNWSEDANGTACRYTVYRKILSDASWGDPVATLPGGATSYTDSGVAVGQVYEYQIVKAADGYFGYGHVLTGIGVDVAGGDGGDGGAEAGAAAAVSRFMATGSIR
jgi:hypothetical protein